MQKIDPANLSQLIKAKANTLGFDLCGIAEARKLHEAETALVNLV